jgi:hypothetical protein
VTGKGAPVASVISMSVNDALAPSPYVGDIPR